VCVCVCVCERERERERITKRDARVLLLLLLQLCFLYCDVTVLAKRMLPCLRAVIGSVLVWLVQKLLHA